VTYTELYEAPTVHATSPTRATDSIQATVIHNTMPYHILKISQLTKLIVSQIVLTHQPKKRRFDPIEGVST